MAIATIKISFPWLPRRPSGAGREAIPSDSGVWAEHLPALNHKVRNVAALELTAEKLGRASFKAGDTVALHSILRIDGKACQIEWKGTFRVVD